MTKEELESEANLFSSIMAWDEEIDTWEDIAERAYLAGAEPREKRIAELEAQIEKMKCGGNCKHLYHVNTGGCYDTKCNLTFCDCINCKDKWEIKENE